MKSGEMAEVLLWHSGEFKIGSLSGEHLSININQ